MIFLEMLIYDFDMLFYFNLNVKLIEVYVVVDVFVRFDFKDKGFLDIVVVMIKFDNGVIVMVEVNF